MGQDNPKPWRESQKQAKGSEVIFNNFEVPYEELLIILEISELILPKKTAIAFIHSYAPPKPQQLPFQGYISVNLISL